MKTKNICKFAICILIALCTCLSVMPFGVSANADADKAAAADIVNLYNRNTAYRGYYNAQGTAVSQNAFSTSDLISVKEGDVVTFGPVVSGQSMYVVAYAGNSVATAISSEAQLTLVDMTDTSVNYPFYSYTVPAGVTAVRTTTRSSLTSYFLTTVNQKFDVGLLWEYWNVVRKQPPSVSEYFPLRTDLSLYRRSAIFVGDSITQAKPHNNCESFYYRGWAGRIGEVNDMRYCNAGKSGYAMSNVMNSVYGQVVDLLLEHEGESYDYVIMHGGIGDANYSAAIGTISPEGTDPATFDQSTYVGALEYLFYTAKRLFPDANYGYIINYPTPTSTSGRMQQIEQYFNEGIKVCEKWDIPYLDLYHDTDFAYNVLKVDKTENLYDDMHLNAKGYDLIYPKIEAWMDSLDPLPQEPEDTTPDTTVAPDTTAAPAEEKGCRSAIEYSTIFSMCVVTLAGAALLLRRRKYQDN